MTDDIRQEWKNICDAYYNTGREQGKYEIMARLDGAKAEILLVADEEVRGDEYRQAKANGMLDALQILKKHLDCDSPSEIFKKHLEVMK